MKRDLVGRAKPAPETGARAEECCSWEGGRAQGSLDRYQRGPCLKLMLHLYDAAQAAGRRYDHQLHADVMAGKAFCPLQGDCERYRRAIERGGTPLHLIPRQLSFAEYVEQSDCGAGAVVGSV